MQMNTLKQFLAAALVIGLVGMVPTRAFAQPMMGPGMMGYGQMGPGMMGPGMMGQGMMGYGPMGSGMMGYGQMGPGMMGPGMMRMAPQSPLNISAEQQTKIGEIQSGVRTKHFELMSQIQAAQLRLEDLYDADKRDQTAINDQHNKVNQLQRQMWESMADAQKRIDAVLTKEQRDTTRRWGCRHMMCGW